jgi:hypothetical protein
MDESLAKIRHERSQKDFPGLSLEDCEYVEMVFKRARICLLLIILGVAFGVIAILLALLLTLLAQSSLDEMGRNFLFVILFALLGAVVVMGMVAKNVYSGNQLYITNKRVIQNIKNTILSSSVNTIDLSSVEDVSFHKDGVMQNLFKYGTLRLATVGDETTYTFKYADVPPEEIEEISKLISDVKNKKKAKED